ncbi:polysaccharide lyase family 8 super-sandwich domain-containing protein [Membranihabitans maritimus]|uniref:polysaccharide lyase family 8 super-sandwich domain-containing protein n=1 Tax=Membranihabitans maritimus TaxID=2904244 RepID=UPI001F007D0D|nr:polysaccharide lyase family 8 super-sandwich domain-containing protein [Membranihabitans maritimus]
MKSTWSKAVIFYIILIMGCLCKQTTYAQSDLSIIKDRIIKEIMAPTIDDSQISQLLATFQEDSTWPGIDYVDTTRTAFQHHIHMENIHDLSRSYVRKGSNFYNSEQVKATINSALNYWLEHDFICQNWWWNQIGIPRTLVEILLILKEDNIFTESQLEESLKIANRAHLEASGARPSGDRIKIAGILAKQLLVKEDKEEFDKVIEVIESEIKFATARGMQYDYSFHHRLDRVNNTLSYGKGYADAFAEWAAYVRGTTYSFSDNSMKMLTDYYLDGICKMMVHGKYPDPGAKNRSISRAGTLDPYGSTTPKRLIASGDYRKDELEEIIAIRNNNLQPSHSHNTFYWHSEHHTHQRPDYFTSVRMFSTRNHNMEVPYNSEGLRNHYLGNGSNFISRTGQEYRDIFPVFDFHKIPGTTLVQHSSFSSKWEIQKEGITDFAGGVTNGLYGAAGFYYSSVFDTIKAKKSWFFFDDEYVCLGSNISSKSDGNVVTTLNQCHLNSDVIISGETVQTLNIDTILNFKKPRWILHDKVGYVLHETDSVYISNKTQSGSWYDINEQSDSPKEKIEKEIFKVWLDHGYEPENDSYTYFVLPNANREKLINFTARNPIEVTANSPTVQAVNHSRLQIAQAVFYQNDTLNIFGDTDLIFHSPGMIMITYNNIGITEITVADPTRKMGKLHFAINDKIYFSNEIVHTYWDSKKGYTEFSVELPQTVYAGQSVNIKF